jgi:predicted transcriptional regulator
MTDTAAQAPAPASGDTYPLLTLRDLANMPAPTYRLQDMVPEGGFVVLYGPSGAAKSFLAIDWSLCVASGLAWYGREAKPGGVLYISAEGSAGLGVRTRAWLTARSQSDERIRIRFLPDAVNFLDTAQLARAARTIQALNAPPALIVVDTMARTMIGGEENSARDVGQFIDAIDRLRRPHNAAALIVHHTGKAGDDERGSSALRGAADAMHSLKPDGASLRLTCEKLKDAEEYSPWNLHLTPTANSCVLALGSNPDALSVQERTILETLPAAFGSDRPTSAKLLAASGIPERSFYRAVTDLEQRGLIDSEQTGRSKLYEITPDGLRALLPTTANDRQAGVTTTASSATTLGVAAGSQQPTAPDRQQP